MLRAFITDLAGRRQAIPEKLLKPQGFVRDSKGMNVKILSMQRVVNYGSFMQAYALKMVIESLGHHVTFCDFEAGASRHVGEKVKKIGTLDRLARLPYILSATKKYVEERQFRRKLRECYKNHAWKKLCIDVQMDCSYNCDAMIIGSDEVFNYTQNHAFGYVPAFFGHGMEAAGSIVSYAASAGYATVKDVEADNMTEELAAGFAKFDALSVRDQNTYEMVAKYTKQPPSLVVDPTLLYDFKMEIPPAPVTVGYVLVYAYDGRLDDAEDVKKILSFAKGKGLRVISVGFYHAWCEENLVVTPFELLSMFKHANYVVTDTFHGTIFSITNRKQFVSLIRGENKWGSNSSKLGFLLQQLDLEGRINRDLGMLAAHLDEPIPYHRVYEQLEKLRFTSLQFLTDALKAAEVKAAVIKLGSKS